MRQQPIAARACGFGERDRRVIDPPPIIQLTVTDPATGVSVRPRRAALLAQRRALHALWNARTARARRRRSCSRTGAPRAALTSWAELVASPSVAKDEHDVEGCFFCFPDLSCRTHGRYKAAGSC